MGEKRKRITGFAIVCVLAVCVGLLIAAQIRMTQGGGEYQGGMISIAQAQSSAAQLASLKAERERLLEELQTLEDQMKAFQEAEAADNTAMQANLEELERYRMAAGGADVHGPGVVIEIDDPAKEQGIHRDSVITYNYELLLILVNKLREAGAEAISINDNRITSYSEISLAGNNININSVATAPPYQVKAIGNPDTLESTLSIRYGILYSMKNDYGLMVSIRQEEDMRIPRYGGVVGFQYAETVE